MKYTVTHSTDALGGQYMDGHRPADLTTDNWAEAVATAADMWAAGVGGVGITRDDGAELLSDPRRDLREGEAVWVDAEGNEVALETRERGRTMTSEYIANAIRATVEAAASGGHTEALPALSHLAHRLCDEADAATVDSLIECIIASIWENS